MKNKSKITCFEAKELLDISCKKIDCVNWINCKEDNNCVLISAKSGPKTLQAVGDIFGLTRMRVCQIEKSILKKIKPYLDPDLN
tara:strand:- start:86 stop:337 length:252 start_codon:yes stop_codon:yes gene_type:complete